MTQKEEGKHLRREKSKREVATATCPSGGNGVDLVEAGKVVQLNPEPVLDQALELWNEMAKANGLSIAQSMSETRKKSLRLRLREAEGIEGWKIALNKVTASPHLLGKNDRKWRADFDFMLQQKSFTRLMEDAYRNLGATRGKLAHLFPDQDTEEPQPPFEFATRSESR